MSNSKFNFKVFNNTKKNTEESKEEVKMEKKQPKVVTMIKDKVEVHKNRSDIEKDIRNPLRRVYRHTIMKAKYGDMNDYHSRACSYYCNAPTPDINQVVEDARAKMKADLEDIWAKEEEKAQKKAEKQAERAAKKEERAAAREAKKAQKDLADEVLKMAEENTEALQNIVDELREINKEAEQQEDFREVKPDEKAVNGVGTSEDPIASNPFISKDEEGLYHFCPIIIKDEEKPAEEEEVKAETPVEEKKEEEAPKTKAKKEPKLPQDKKPAAKKASSKKAKK